MVSLTAAQTALPVIVVTVDAAMTDEEIDAIAEALVALMRDEEQ